MGAALRVDRDRRYTGAVALLVRVADRAPVEGREPGAEVRGVDQPGLVGPRGAPGHQVGVTVRALPDTEQTRMQLLVATDLARGVPEAAGAAFRPAQDGVARG